MGNERVDKAWQKQGLEKYSTGAILGTLAHYGVPLDEAGFRELAGSQYPGGIAERWSEQWKGTGQFSRFHEAAAEELWRRLLPDRLAPAELSDGLTSLMDALSDLVAGSPEAPVGPAFARLQALRERMPKKADGSPDDGFLDEALQAFDEDRVKQFDELAESLAREGHTDDAESFAELEEFLLPERKGVTQAIVRAAAGEREQAVEQLTGLVRDAQRKPEARLLAVDGLIHLEAHAEAAREAQALLEALEAAKEHHVAIALCARLAHVYEALGDRTALRAMDQTLARLEAAHHEAHPHHRR